jgi:pseudouridine-5'-phosphate glycosidase
MGNDRKRKMKTPSFVVLHPTVARALRRHDPIVALETAVVTHGLPYPENIDLAVAVEKEVSSLGATPATIGVLDGKVHIGLSLGELLELAQAPGRKKVTSQNYAHVLTSRAWGGTTVAGTLVACQAAGIRIFSTGGIGGVHRGNSHDISADLIELSRCPVIVVCSGAKAILDLPATLEALETLGVPVVGFRTKEFPAFYSRDSGLAINTCVDDPCEIVDMALVHWQLGSGSALLVANPPSASNSLPFSMVNDAVKQALAMAEEQKVYGSDVTPFLLSKVSELTHGESLQVNLGLLNNNANLAARIACALAS